MASEHRSGNTHHQGAVKDPEHDGRLKENREAGQTKGTTPASRERAEGHGHEPAASSQSRGHGREEENRGGSRGGEAQASGGDKGGGDDLKSREYTDAQGNVHHHTKAYEEQHRGDQK